MKYGQVEVKCIDQASIQDDEGEDIWRGVAIRGIHEDGRARAKCCAGDEPTQEEIDDLVLSFDDPDGPR